MALELGTHRADSFTAADLIVLSPGVPMELPEVALARAAGVPVIGELELASRWVRGPVVAITGTKGKSTTTTLVGRMLEAAGKRVLVGGNIGVPLSAQVESSTDDTVHVVEASSFQLEATDRFHPKIAALLNFSPDHLDRHPSVAAYAAAKQRVFANQTAEDWTVVNANSAAALDLARLDAGTTGPLRARRPRRRPRFRGSRLHLAAHVGRRRAAGAAERGPSRGTASPEQCGGGQRDLVARRR